ncbi:hypothetical protein DSD19_09705 [Rhodovulum sp. BSW8]|uniref:hypothetical protein n=1 Tax=Rhodovulum sp. BSW8 TaxID=2259645 RepID=UPI000DE3AEBC|nr:hypothetical protein [Rhodovulum sp. BSW8]RBO53217.1 hypothetical protein DSD19_09705 [Rhodovulum sp. BSW8]
MLFGPDAAPHPTVQGDDTGATDIAADLIRAIGLKPLDAGGLRTGRFAAPFALGTAARACIQPGGAALICRFDSLRG